MTETNSQPDTPACCSNCRFWIESFRDESKGRCHRFPPASLIYSTNLISSQFPETGLRDWCGEFQATNMQKARLPLVADLKLTARAWKIIRGRLQFTTIEQLCSISERELRLLPQCGDTTINEIRAKLAERGLKLAGE